MTETKAFVTIDNTDADADAAYDRVLPEAQALPSEKLVPINIDVSAALITAMGVAERLPGLQQDLQTVSPALAAAATKYGDYVLALFSAQSRYAMATTPPAVMATFIIRDSGGPSVVVMKPIQYRNCSDLSSSI